VHKEFVEGLSSILATGGDESVHEKLYVFHAMHESPIFCTICCTVHNYDWMSV
jgi:hypothetical protein